MQPRPICKACRLKPASVNYIKNGVRHYRSKCGLCNAGNKPLSQPTIPKYFKKQLCERCGFKAEERAQLHVYFIDGNRKNYKQSNLKTVCANCHIKMIIRGTEWKQGDLIPDL